MKEIDSLLKILQCTCGGVVSLVNNAAVCSSCQKNYGTASAKFFSFVPGKKSANAVSENPDSLIAQIKYFFKNFPKIYFALAYIFGGRQVNQTAQKFVNQLSSQATVVNVGSGTKSLGSKVIDLDFYPFPNVSLVALVEKLPFKNSSLDAIVCDNVLEHVKDPGQVVAEIFRVLKPGGLVYVGVPFIINYHSSPNDFQRWTVEGLRHLMRGFNERELKIACGPTSAMTTILGEWLALLLSFNVGFLYNIFLIFFTIVLTPLKLLDYLLSFYKRADNIAYGFYFVGVK